MKEDFDPTKIINKAKEEHKQKSEFKETNSVTTIQDPGYRDNYANSINVTVSLWDFMLVFGAIKNDPARNVVVVNFQGMYISPQQAKALSNVLVDNIKNYEKTFGEIKLTPKDQTTM